MGFPNFSGPHGKKQMVPVKIAGGRGEGKGFLRIRAAKRPGRRLALGLKSLNKSKCLIHMG